MRMHSQRRKKTLEDCDSVINYSLLLYLWMYKIQQKKNWLLNILGQTIFRGKKLCVEKRKSQRDERFCELNLFYWKSSIISTNFCYTHGKIIIKKGNIFEYWEIICNLFLHKIILHLQNISCYAYLFKLI